MRQPQTFFRRQSEEEEDSELESTSFLFKLSTEKRKSRVASSQGDSEERVIVRRHTQQNLIVQLFKFGRRRGRPAVSSMH